MYVKLIKKLDDDMKGGWRLSLGDALCKLAGLYNMPDIPESEWYKYRIRSASTDSAPQSVPEKAKACAVDEANWAENDFEDRYYGNINGKGWNCKWDEKNDCIGKEYYQPTGSYGSPRINTSGVHRTEVALTKIIDNEKIYTWIEDENELKKIAEMIREIRNK